MAVGEQAEQGDSQQGECRWLGSRTAEGAVERVTEKCVVAVDELCGGSGQDIVAAKGLLAEFGSEIGHAERPGAADREIEYHAFTWANDRSAIADPIGEREIVDSKSIAVRLTAVTCGGVQRPTGQHVAFDRVRGAVERQPRNVVRAVEVDLVDVERSRSHRGVRDSQRQRRGGHLEVKDGVEKFNGDQDRLAAGEVAQYDGRRRCGRCKTGEKCTHSTGGESALQKRNDSA